MSDPAFDESLAMLMSEFTASGIAELLIRRGDFELFLSNTSGSSSMREVQQGPSPPPLARTAPEKPRSPAAATTPQQNTAPQIPADAVVIEAPNLGTFYRAPKPGAPDYVDVGSTVAAGDELCLIEVMKLFTAVRAGAPGKIVAILADDGSMVAAGQPLFAVMPD